MFNITKCNVPQLVKTTEYYGIKLTIPSDHHWIAMDDDGDVYSYQYQPEPTFTGCWQTFDGTNLYLCNVEHIGDWKQSLMMF